MFGVLLFTNINNQYSNFTLTLVYLLLSLDYLPPVKLNNSGRADVTANLFGSPSATSNNQNDNPSSGARSGGIRDMMHAGETPVQFWTRVSTTTHKQTVDNEYETFHLKEQFDRLQEGIDVEEDRVGQINWTMKCLLEAERNGWLIYFFKYTWDMKKEKIKYDEHLGICTHKNRDGPICMENEDENSDFRGRHLNRLDDMYDMLNDEGPVGDRLQFLVRYYGKRFVSDCASYDVETQSTLMGRTLLPGQTVNRNYCAKPIDSEGRTGQAIYSAGCMMLKANNLMKEDSKLRVNMAWGYRYGLQQGSKPHPIRWPTIGFDSRRSVDRAARMVSVERISGRGCLTEAELLKNEKERRRIRFNTFILELEKYLLKCPLKKGQAFYIDADKVEQFNLNKNLSGWWRRYCCDQAVDAEDSLKHLFELDDDMKEKLNQMNIPFGEGTAEKAKEERVSAKQAKLDALMKMNK